MICPYFYFYHKELYCRCVDDKSECMGILEKCENKLGKQSYLADLEEKKDERFRKL